MRELLALIRGATIGLFAMSTLAMFSLIPLSAQAVLLGGVPVYETVNFEDIYVKWNVSIPTDDFSSGSLFFDTDETNAGFTAGLSNGAVLDQPSGDIVAYNGGTFFHSSGVDNNGWTYPEVIFRLYGGGLFDLYSFDIAERGELNMAGTVQVVGTFEEAAPVIRVIILDGVMDGLGGADDFENILFDAQWTDLVSVSLQSLSGENKAAWAIDNVEIAYVPEPSMALLQLVALSCLLTLRSRKRS